MIEANAGPQGSIPNLLTPNLLAKGRAAAAARARAERAASRACPLGHYRDGRDPATIPSPIADRDEWVAARKRLLAKEKEFTKLRDRLAAELRSGG
ncbi:MAG TPA: DUF899 family protein [Stellaceae bacterium]|jgi:hypothetical protein|nr:DUF899 family protein [Stellaceae bacterium]